MADLFVPNSPPTKEGYLWKKSEWLGIWRKRYFRLVRSQLFFFADEKAGTKPHGVIELRHCLTVKSAEERTGKPHAFEVATPDKVFFMYAESDELKDEWIGKIGKAIVDNSRSQIREVIEVDEDDEEA